METQTDPDEIMWILRKMDVKESTLWKILQMLYDEVDFEGSEEENQNKETQS